MSKVVDAFIWQPIAVGKPLSSYGIGQDGTRLLNRAYSAAVVEAAVFSGRIKGSGSYLRASPLATYTC